MNSESATVEIVEVSPRDGLQNETRSASTAAKIELIRRLGESGARRIEAVSFVHPRLVPNMADAEAVMAGVSRRPDVSLIGVALNERGVRRAIDAGVDEVNFVIPASEEFAAANQNATRQALLDELARSSNILMDSGTKLTVTVAVAFGCPFGGEVPASEVDWVLREAHRRVRIDEVGLADTIGCGVPRQVRELFALESVRSTQRMRAHLHETRHTAVANAIAAIQIGVRALDASVAGLGGCPFAPGAAGNITTEDLAWALSAEGHECGVDVQALTEAGRYICGEIEVSPRSGIAAAGVFPPLTLPEVKRQRVD